MLQSATASSVLEDPTTRSGRRAGRAREGYRAGPLPDIAVRHRDSSDARGDHRRTSGHTSDWSHGPGQLRHRCTQKKDAVRAQVEHPPGQMEPPPAPGVWPPPRHRRTVRSWRRGRKILVYFGWWPRRGHGAVIRPLLDAPLWCLYRIDGWLRTRRGARYGLLANGAAFRGCVVPPECLRLGDHAMCPHRPAGARIREIAPG